MRSRAHDAQHRLVARRWNGAARVTHKATGITFRRADAVLLVALRFWPVVYVVGADAAMVHGALGVTLQACGSQRPGVSAGVPVSCSNSGSGRVRWPVTCAPTATALLPAVRRCCYHPGPLEAGATAAPRWHRADPTSPGAGRSTGEGAGTGSLTGTACAPGTNGDAAGGPAASPSRHARRGVRR
jgi:hypothetical protein